MLTIRIKTGGSAFGQDSWERDMEVARILTELAHKIKNGYEPESINDTNGNKVCTVEGY